MELQSEGDRGLWPHVVYVNSSVEYAKLKHEGYNLYNAGTSGVNSAGGSKIKRPSPRRLRRWLCEKDHPRVEHAKVRIGSFIGVKEVACLGVDWLCLCTHSMLWRCRTAGAFV